MKLAEQTLMTVMAIVLHVSEETINDQTSMKTLGAWDSLRHMEVILALEEEFALPRLDLNEIVEMTSIASIKCVLRSKGVDL